MKCVKCGGDNDRADRLCLACRVRQNRMLRARSIKSHQTRKQMEKARAKLFQSR